MIVLCVNIRIKKNHYNSLYKFCNVTMIVDDDNSVLFKSGLLGFEECFLHYSMKYITLIHTLPYHSAGIYCFKKFI